MLDERIIQLQKTLEQPCPKCNEEEYVVKDNRAVVCECRKNKKLMHSLEAADIPPKYEHVTLDNFKEIDGTCTKLKTMAKSYAQSFKPGCTGFLFKGKTGSGKTHLAVSILKELLFKGYQGLYTNTVDLLQFIRSVQFNAWKYDELTDIMDHILKQDLLILDDLGAEKVTDWTQERLYSLINKLYVNNKTIIVTSNVDLHELSLRLGDHTVSRLCEMCMHDIKFPDKDYRRVFLRHSL